MTMVTRVLISSSGFTEAMTESPMVQRKNAMVSTSKPLRRMILLKKNRIHIKIDVPKREMKIFVQSSTSQPIISCSTEKN